MEEGDGFCDSEESNSSDETSHNVAMTSKSSGNPILPPTPPGATDGQHGREEILSAPVTPPLRQSPPTPDITPPRRSLGTQPSMASTTAESFRTAREEFVSDDDTDSMFFSRKSPASTLRSGRGRLTPNRLTGQSAVINESVNSLANGSVSRDQSDVRKNSPAILGHSNEQLEQSFGQKLPKRRRNDPDRQSADSNRSVSNGHVIPAEAEESSQERVPQRGLSLRDRLKAQELSTPSTDRFGDSIGWVDESARALRDSRRISEASPPSTVEAMVYDTPTILKRQQTLRHRGKTDSLRAVSSPFPSRTNRDSLISNPEMSPTLHHKKARLSNQNRWSYGSEVSRPYSIVSSSVLPPAEAEVIKVAVVPERKSSVRSSANSSQRHSVAMSADSVDDHYPPNSYHSRERGSDLSHRRRSASDTYSPSKNRSQPPYDLDLGEPPVVPPRRSSLSAPTSVSNSRTSSFTSRSEHLRTRRIAAEKDLRKTLDRMESERLIPKLQSLVPEAMSVPGQAGATVTPSREPVRNPWDSLRPPSILNTPYSQPSAMSVSPGPVEMGEARTVNFFPHNNNSLQLIDKHRLSESGAARKARQLIANEPQTPSTLYDSKRNSQNTAVNNSLSTPSTTRRSLTLDSPLRNPRQPPEPPRVKIVPPSSTGAGESPSEINNDHDLHQNIQLSSRPSKRLRSESFVKSITRNFSLRNARNRKADQDLDSQQHPFWRPRGFWDGFVDDDDKLATEPTSRERGLATNSLRIPPGRGVVNGPTSMLRSVSDGSRRSWRNGDLNSHPSYNSLTKLRAGHKMYKIPGLPAHFRFIGFRDIQGRMLTAKARREDELRERKRDDLRRSIGTNVISQGDSRFPIMTPRRRIGA